MLYVDISNTRLQFLSFTSFVKLHKYVYKIIEYNVCISYFLSGMPSVITLAPKTRPEGKEPMSYGDACRELEKLGADVVGVNCIRGPQSILPVIKEVRQKCKVNY